MNKKMYLWIFFFMVIATSILSCNTKESFDSKKEVKKAPEKTKVETNIPHANKITNNKTTNKKPFKVIATYKTIILDNSKHRVFNIDKAAEKLNSYLLKPNTVFSFNGVIGERASENGYKKAKVLVKGKREEATGGGICQLSSTLYNAIHKLKLPILERHNHTGEVHYIPIGMDAAVAYNNLDFKFKNTLNYPIKFKVYIKNGYLFVQILKAY